VLIGVSLNQAGVGLLGLAVPPYLFATTNEVIE
jgi:hypothetical protein